LALLFFIDVNLRCTQGHPLANSTSTAAGQTNSSPDTYIESGEIPALKTVPVFACSNRTNPMAAIIPFTGEKTREAMFLTLAHSNRSS
jgi:hypothetical protein